MFPGGLTSPAGYGSLRQGDLETKFDFADVRSTMRCLVTIARRICKIKAHSVRSDNNDSMLTPSGC